MNIGHAWNRVKLDGIWYNTDLTWDMGNICSGTTPNYCLQSTSEFGHDTYIVQDDEQQMDVTYDQKELCEKYFPVRRFEIETGNQVYYQASEVLDILEQLKRSPKCNSDEIDISFISLFGPEYGDVGVIISNVVDGIKYEAEYEGSSILFEEKDFYEFMMNYITEAKELKCTTESKEKIVTGCDGVRLTISEEVEQILQTLGVDIDTFNQSVSITDMQEENQNDINQESVTSELHGMTVYRESLMKKIVRNVKNTYEKIKGIMLELISKRKKRDIIQEPEDISNKNQKLPSWDLRNWSQKELQEHKVAVASPHPDNMHTINRKINNKKDDMNDRQ